MRLENAGVCATLPPLLRITVLALFYISVSAALVFANESFARTVAQGFYDAGVRWSGNSDFYIQAKNVVGAKEWIDPAKLADYADGESGSPFEYAFLAIREKVLYAPWNAVEMEKLGDDDESRMRRNDIGFVFQAYNLIDNLTLEENILLPALLEGKKKKDVMKKAEALMGTVGILKRRHHTPKELSGGEQQRTAIARALVNDPAILFADEPIGNLDNKTGKEILELLREINREKGITILTVTHSEESTQYGKRVIRLRDGEIVGAGDSRARLGDVTVVTNKDVDVKAGNGQTPGR